MINNQTRRINIIFFCLVLMILTIYSISSYFNHFPNALRSICLCFRPSPFCFSCINRSTIFIWKFITNINDILCLCYLNYFINTSYLNLFIL